MFPTSKKQNVTQSVTPATEAPESGRIPFFNVEPLPGESIAETSVRRAFLEQAAKALVPLEISLQGLLLFFVEQKNQFALMTDFISKQSFKDALWDMFEALMRDELTALDFETRADACIIYRWLQTLTNTMYAA